MLDENVVIYSLIFGFNLKLVHPHDFRNPCHKMVESAGCTSTRSLHEKMSTLMSEQILGFS